MRFRHLLSFLALATCAQPALAQTNATGTLGRTAPINAQQVCGQDDAGRCVAPRMTPDGRALSAAAGSTAASATPSIATVTPTGATSTSGTCTFANGTALCPFTPDLGRPIWLKYAPAGSSTFTVQIGESTDNCASYTLLTVGGQPVSFTSLYNEYWGILPATPRTLCQVVTVTAGSLAIEARN